MIRAITIGIKRIQIFSDSQVVVRQVNDEYTVNAEGLKRYVEMAKQQKCSFPHFALKKIAREDNQLAYHLSKVASSDHPNDSSVHIEVDSIPLIVESTSIMSNDAINKA